MEKWYNINRFKNNGGGVYFEEVLEKIRDIRSSEKVFWRKILELRQRNQNITQKEIASK